MVIDSVWASAEAPLRGAAWLPPFFNLPLLLYIVWEYSPLRNCVLSFLWKSMLLLEGGGMTERSTSQLLSFFKPVSFSLEASPYTSPCPLATDVWYKKKEPELFCGWRYHVFFLSFFHADLLYFLSFLLVFLSFFFLPWTRLPKKERKKEWKKNQRRGSIRSNSVYEVVVFFSSSSFFFLFQAVLRRSIWVAKERDQNVFQSLLIPLSSKSQRRAEEGKQRERGALVERGGTDT